MLLTGDEDLREAALFAQGFGLSLVVAGFPGTARQGQSELLLREADHVVRLDAAQVAAHLSMTPGRPTQPAAAPAAPDETVVDVGGAEDALRELCQGVVGDPRFVEDATPLLNGDRLSRRADKVLVARLSELTGEFPVPADLLGRAPNMCIGMAAARG